VLETAIVTGIRPADQSPAQVRREFQALLDDGVRITPSGSTRHDPLSLLARGYTPLHKVQLFDATYYLTNMRLDETFRFFVGYVWIGNSRKLFPRILYKDSSLVWRSATHYIRSEDENWIGKGALRSVIEDGEELLYSAEETTDLPFELQFAFDVVSRRVARARRDLQAVGLVLRHAPDDRMEPYQDFSGPRRRAMAKRRNRINGGERVAWFERPGDPASLRFASGYEPDFEEGIIEVTASGSNLYGGAIRKFRILSANRQIQYQFIAAPKQLWIIPAQALTTEIMSYGVRTVDVLADEDLFVPGYEYHYMDDTVDPPELHTQIPEGFAGQRSEVDPMRCETSPWLEKLPVIQSFRRSIPDPLHVAPTLF
jgi:hypothetical protein